MPGGAKLAALACSIAVLGGGAFAAKPAAPPARPPALEPLATPAPGATTADALGEAFRFATAIEADTSDQAMAQETVVAELIDLGRLNEAGERAESIKGWRKGTVFADLARAWAEAGNKDRARGYVDKADAVRRSTPDWGEPRIAAHLAQALAILGDLDKATRIAADLTSDDPRQYAGRAVTAVASGMAHNGDFEGAMARLAALDQERDFDVVWWRTSGYLDLARRRDLPAVKRAEALRAARRSADGVPGWKRGEALIGIGREYALAKDAAAGKETLAVAERTLVSLPATAPEKGRLIAGLASAWGFLGEKERSRRLVKAAEKEVPSGAVIDRPGSLGALAGALWSIGDQDQALALYRQALSEAGSLVNARPRALAVVEICRSLGRQQVALDGDLRRRLESLFAGLRDPW